MVADKLDISTKEVSDLVQDAPFVSQLPAVPSSNGTVHQYSKEIAAPTVGFRTENTGRDFSKSGDVIVATTLKILDASFAVDKAVADAWQRGGAQAYLAREAGRHIGAAMFKAEQQYFNGTVSADAGGFTGFADASTLATLGANQDVTVLDAEGSTANTGSSFYLIRQDSNNVQGVYKGDGGFVMGDPVVQDMVDANGKHYPAYYVPMTLWLGIEVGGKFSIVRIANITKDAGKGLTDDLIYEALSLFPAGRKPTAGWGNRRTVEQLRKSRTGIARNENGLAPGIATSVGPLPIFETDAISNVEALLV